MDELKENLKLWEESQNQLLLALREMVEVMAQANKVLREVGEAMGVLTEDLQRVIKSSQN